MSIHTLLKQMRVVVLGAFLIVAVAAIWPRSSTEAGGARHEFNLADSSTQSLTTLDRLLPSFSNPPLADDAALASRIPGGTSWPESENDGNQVVWDPGGPASYDGSYIWLDLLFNGGSIFKQHDPDSVSVEGDLDPSDVVEIQRLVRSIRGIHRAILSIEVIDKNEVEIMTGIVRGPLDGGGNLLRAKKRDGRWKITSISSWVS